MIEREHLVVVGNGLAGVNTMENMLKLAPNRYKITVFGSRALSQLQPYPAIVCPGEEQGH